MSRDEKERWLDALEDDIRSMLEYGLPLSLVFCFLAWFLARWVI